MFLCVDACALLWWDCRWVLTGTPTNRLSADRALAGLKAVCEFLRHPLTRRRFFAGKVVHNQLALLRLFGVLLLLQLLLLLLVLLLALLPVLLLLLRILRLLLALMLCL